MTRKRDVGPMHLKAPEALKDGATGYGREATFETKTIRINWRLMAGLVDRELAEVRAWRIIGAERKQMWVANITEAGRKVLEDQHAQE